MTTYCIKCFEQIDEYTRRCPHCGENIRSYELNQRVLRPLSILNEKYLVGKVIGEGGFGITYIAYDTVLESRVAIKEYFPTNLVSRDTSAGIQSSLSVLTGSHEEQYKKGMERFVKEAENLAKFNNLPGIVSVRDFFYANNTAYMVMEYIEGITLKDYLKQKGEKLPYQEVLEMMKPVMKSLQTVHSAGIIHRDISPDNIMVQMYGNTPELKLIDFGAARFVGNDDEKSLTVILKHGYAPPEQYQTKGKQGPWTDVYALAATMYRMITGVVPQASPDRLLTGKKLKTPVEWIPGIRKDVSDTIMMALEPDVNKRIKNIGGLKNHLYMGNRRAKGMHPVIIAAVVAAFAVAVIGVFLLSRVFVNNEKTDADGAGSVTATVTEEKETTEASNGAPEPESYTAFREFFYANHDLSGNDEYYCYFYDVRNMGEDDMIVVQPEYYEDADIDYLEIRGYAVSFYRYFDSAVSLYHTELVTIPLDGYDFVVSSVMPGTLYTGETRGLFIGYRDNRVCLAKMKTADDYQKPFYTMELFDFDETGIPKHIADVEYSDLEIEQDGGSVVDNTVYDVLPGELQQFICLSDARFALFHDNSVGGIRMSANHDYRNVFEENGIERSKAYDDRAREIAMNSDAILTDVYFGDMDHDGKTETITGFLTGKIPASPNYLDTIGYEVYGESNGIEALITTLYTPVGGGYWKRKAELDTPGYQFPLAFSQIQYGNEKGVIIGHILGGVGGGRVNHKALIMMHHGEFSLWGDNEKNDYEWTYDYGSSGPLNVDRNGRIYILALGEQQIDTFSGGVDVIVGPASHVFFVNIINGELYEYDSVVITTEDLERIPGWQEALANAVSAITERFSFDTRIVVVDIKIREILFSSDDRVFINYEAHLQNGSDSGYKCYSAEFDVTEQGLQYKKLCKGHRQTESGHDIKSYTKPFPY